MRKPKQLRRVKRRKQKITRKEAAKFLHEKVRIRGLDIVQLGSSIGHMMVTLG